MPPSVDITWIVRINQRHVAIHAVARLLGVVEGARALPRDAARLPVVVFVEAAEPAVLVYRNIQMHFVTARAELRTRAHKGLHEKAAMCFGSRICHESLEVFDNRIRT